MPVELEVLLTLLLLLSSSFQLRAGVKGIGQKGGSRLLEKFETLEGLFAGLESVGSMPIRGSKGLQALLRYEHCCGSILNDEPSLCHSNTRAHGVN